MKLHIERTTTINKPAAQVYTIISDLGQWNTWSPWIHSEPTAKTVLSGKAQQTGQNQSWDGEVIGSGKMTIEQLEANKTVKIKLEFFKPWKSLSAVTFNIQSESADKTKVTWVMDGSLPWFMFFFKNMMAAYMSYDFDRGLSMLKEYAETGSVSSKSIYQGEKPQQSFQVTGITTTCAISELSQQMQKDYGQMTQLMQKGEFTQPKKAMAIYHKFDIPKGVCEYTAAYVYDAEQNVKTPAGYEVKKVSPHNALVVDHFGSYRHLGNPWSMAMSYQRGKKMKLRKDVPMYEIYVTMPDGRPEKDIHTQILMPVK
ncbi:SRPBCC family protein [bacterium]|nr:SRPBCC family protein [bacterium]